MRVFAYRGYVLGILLGVMLLFGLSWTPFHVLRMSGELHTGHKKLTCPACHERAEGSLRQQIQANFRYLLQQHPSLSAFNFATPDNSDCLACHEREDDRHPVYRFNEPRFSAVRKAIQPQVCISCHQQHQGVMFTGDTQNCRHCHEEMRLKDDLIIPSHEKLIDTEQWQSCLACHDFHGNHDRHVPTMTTEMLDQQDIEYYLQGIPNSDPYAEEKTMTAKETRHEE